MLLKVLPANRAVVPPAGLSAKAPAAGLFVPTVLKTLLLRALRVPCLTPSALNAAKPPKFPSSRQALDRFTVQTAITPRVLPAVPVPLMLRVGSFSRPSGGSGTSKPSGGRSFGGGRTESRPSAPRESSFDSFDYSDFGDFGGDPYGAPSTGRGSRKRNNKRENKERSRKEGGGGRPKGRYFDDDDDEMYY